MNSDALFEITKNVNDVKSLVIMCSLNKEMLELCRNHSKQVFLFLMKNANFRKSFYNTLETFINTHNHSALLSLMKWYPVGKMFPEQYAYMNMLQTELLKDTSQQGFSKLFVFLFYPTNYIKFSLEDILRCHITVMDNALWKENFFKIIGFHFSHANKFRKTQKLFNKIINSIISDVNFFDSYTFENILDALFEGDATTLQLTLFKAIFEPVVSNTDISIDSIEIQDEYADKYDYIKKWYMKYALDGVRQKHMNPQSGGSLFAIASTIAKTAATSPLVKQIGQQVATQVLQQVKSPVTQQIGKQMLQQASTNAIDNASKYVHNKTGIKVDTRDLKSSINQNIEKKAQSTSWF